MPWDAASFRGRHNHHLTPPQAAHAARIANAVLRSGVPEGESIAIANKYFQHRDAGGGVDPLQGGVGGLAPSAQTMNPLQQGLIQQYSSLPVEKLQELAARAGATPQGQLIRALLQRRLMQPNAQPQVQQQPAQQQAAGAGFGPPAMRRGGALHRAPGGSIAPGSTAVVLPYGNGAPVSAAPMSPTGSTITPGFSGMDLGPVGRTVLSAAGFIPGPVGMAASLANLGVRGYNTQQVNNALTESGLSPLSVGQTIGAMLGPTIGNQYGTGTNQSVQDAIAAAGGNTQSAGSPGFSIGAASGADVPGDHSGGINAGAGMGPPGGGIGQSNGGGGEYRRGGPLRRAFGGPASVPMSMADPWWARSEARSADTAPGGFLAGTTGGRADAIKTTAPGGAYVLPADVVAGLGDGNSLAGARVWDEILRSGPHGTPMPRESRGAGPPRPPRATGQQGFARAGGVPAKHQKAQPVALSHGEVVVSPADVLRIGRGDMKKGWRELDQFVLEQRERYRKKLATLPGPVGAKENKR